MNVKIKRALKKIPFISNFRKRRTLKFITSHQYWENRYRFGGNSGAGSYNRLAEYKGSVINDFIVENNVESVIELGCGDGNQLGNFKVKNYVGFDVSKTAIHQCRKIYKNDASKQFYLMESLGDIKADLVLSLDVIYHLVEDDVFVDYMEKLFSASNKYVIIYSSNTDKNFETAPHVKHRKFTTWIEQHTSFHLMRHIPNKYPFDKEKKGETTFADFYFFERD